MEGIHGSFYPLKHTEAALESDIGPGTTRPSATFSPSRSFPNDREYDKGDGGGGVIVVCL
jgi:hypothetical protein